ncbi:P-loop containing nucleoside triphosphate hydrolase [Sesbania bispinosa]|nr:P-loop containing nucleoside triphosphate hydrolase [Sesbania bispinosa]
MAREEEEKESCRGIRVHGMQFSYPGQEPPLFLDFNLDVSPGSRCLLVGANGSGKTTLLKILAGKHMVGGRDVVRVLNGSAFHDTQLVCSGDLAYLGGSWSKNVGSAGEIPLQGDFSAEHMIFGVEGTDPDRRDRLIELLDIDLQWRMHKVLLLDEVTVDLDVVTRMDLLDFFREECEQREATIVYATHIFDGLETWATHLAYIQDGELRRAEKFSAVNELKSSANLLSVVESWLRAETKLEKKKPVQNTSLVQKTSSASSPFFSSSRHMAYYR